MSDIQSTNNAAAVFLFHHRYRKLFNAVAPLSVHDIIDASRLVSVQIQSFDVAKNIDLPAIAKVMNHCAKLTRTWTRRELEDVVIDAAIGVRRVVDDDLRINDIVEREFRAQSPMHARLVVHVVDGQVGHLQHDISL